MKKANPQPNVVETKEPEKTEKTFYETTEFPELKLFDDNYEGILSELKNILEIEKKRRESENQNVNNGKEEKEESKFFELWCENNLYEESNPNGWNVAPLMINYVRDQKRCDRVPFLMSLVNKLPGLITVSYSMLKPGTWIVPHKGYDNYSALLLRYHLGLIIPKGDLALRCEKDIKGWENGKSWIFDDSLTHEAWNFGNEDRYVLIIDFSSDKTNNIII